MSNKAWMLKNFDRKPVTGGLLINKGGGKGRPKDCLNKDRSSYKSHYVN